MPDRMIINARRELGWRRRIVSDVATVLLWAGWLLLWIPAFRKLEEVIRLKLSFQLGAIQVLETVDPISVRTSLIALLGTCTLLLLWTLMPRRQVTHAHAVATLADYAEHFKLPAAQISAGRSSRIVVVHHDEAGAVVAVEAEASSLR